MVYPLVALFFGTGNQTPHVSAAVIARVFRDPSLALFEYDPERLLSQTPQNIAFPDLEELYTRMQRQLSASGCVFHLGTRVSRVRRGTHGVEVQMEAAPSTWRGGSSQTSGDRMSSPIGNPEESKDAKALSRGSLVFDSIILACPANVALQVLEDPSRAERSVLGGVEYFHDLTVTHTDDEYMRKHNELDERAVYFIKSYDERPDCCEMGFDLTGYQPMLQQARAKGHRVYQTIFLNRDDSKSWTNQQINPSKILDSAWWIAFSHTYKHFRRVVPWVWRIQGKRNTFYAGSWTLFNTHDIAISSGLAAAEQLGAPYPFGENALALHTYKTVLMASHLSRYKPRHDSKKHR